jgi:cytochrome b561
MKFGRFTRLLHLLIAVGITLELLSSLFMKTPRPGRVLTPLQSLGYEIHQWVGMAVLVALALHWTVFAAGHAHKGIGHFFPWFSRSRMTEIAREVRELLRFRIADPDRCDSLSGAVEGIGLVLGTLLAVSGAWLFFGAAPDGTLGAALRPIRKFHEFWGPAMWAYLGVHAGAAMLHLGLGHRSILAVFRL